MLAQLRIRDLGVIDDALLELSAGLNVVTGETGAGKTMVVTGLGLLLGARADSGSVRTGAATTVVEGLADPVPGHRARARVAEAGGDADGELVLVRTLTAQGRSRAHVGGRAAPVGVLAEVGELLVAVHGQADQWRLRRPEEHRALLDDFGGEAVRGPRQAYEQEYARAAALTAELARVTDLERDRDVESQVLRAELDRLAELDPQPGEEDELAAEDARLAHVDSLREAAERARAALAGGDDTGADGGGAGAAEALVAARSALAGGVDHDETLAQLERRVAELGYLAADIGAELSGYLAGLDADPARHAWVQERRAQLGALLRRHGPSTVEALAWGERAAIRLAELDSATERAGQIETELQACRGRLRHRADDLTDARREAAGELARRVTAELAQLAMASARVEVVVEPTPRPGPHGADTVQIALAANPGSPARSVAKAASGGELSRIMLAIEVVIADALRRSGPTDPAPDRAPDIADGPAPDIADGPADDTAAGTAGPATDSADADTGTAPGDDADASAGAASDAVPTFVFDEVDAGVGGRAGLAIGRRLAALSRSAQVVVVTHLPQVAAFADRHLVVHKTDDGHVTASGVRVVTGDDRLAELARMMAGTDSDIAREHAAALLAEAAARRDDHEQAAAEPTAAARSRPAPRRRRARAAG